MSKGLEALKRVHELIILECGSYYENNYEEIKTIEKELKALEIFMKYVSFQEIDDDFFKYEVVDKQYVSNSSELLITDDEYKFIKEIFND